MSIFSPQFPHQFKLFSSAHVGTMLFFASLWIVIPLLFRFKSSEQGKTYLRYTLAFILLSQSVGWLLWEIIVGKFSIQLSLPFNLCDISNLLCVVLLLRPNKKLYEVLYFWALAGAIQSFVTPNIYYGFPHVEFLVFYVQHGGEILTILFLTIACGMRPTTFSAFRSIGYLVAYLTVVYIFNLLTNSNYMFLMADTPNPSAVTKMIAIFGKPPLHIIGLGLITIASHIVLYLPFAIKDIKARLSK